MPIRAVTFDVDEAVLDKGTIGALAATYVLGVLTDDPPQAAPAGESVRFAFRLSGAAVGVRMPDPRLFAMAAAGAACRTGDLVHVGVRLDTDVRGAQAAGARAVWLNLGGVPCPTGIRPDAVVASLTELPAALAALDRCDTTGGPTIGVGPHPEPWPDDPRLDRVLLAEGDGRNVADRYRYWRLGAIVADLDDHRHPFHVAVENWTHDLNIGTVVRNANAFSAATVRIVGRRRWNRRGAMVTDRYQHIEHHATIEAFVGWAGDEQLPIVGVDNLPGALPLDSVTLPERCVLLFGQEGPGLSAAARRAASLVCSIRQFGSTRSINAGVASGIAMHAWASAHAHDR